ncbi:MAG: hypothetical protein HC809_11440, partial [Gammaproteobacteria bacterium]|nr:hypothetical protein [Gammaproteobacteria bacterium]
MAVSFEDTMRSLERDSRNTGLRFVAAGVALLAAWSVIAFTVELPLSVTSIDGRVVAAAQPVDVTSITREPIVAVGVRLGQRVNKGDVLVEFDSTSLSFDLDSRTQRIAKLRDEMASVRKEIDSSRLSAISEAEEFDRAMDRLRARIGETQARIEHAQTAERLYGELRSEKRIDALQYSEARSNLEQSHKVLEAERAELKEKEAAKQLAFSRRTSLLAGLERDLAALAGEIAELEPKVRQLERRIADMRIQATFAGEVGAMASLAVGQTYAPGDWLLT